jgi:predicted SnoaL-like aldol condensation-catalyzing enzyme
VEKFFTPTYIQHNPNVATGRDALVTYMKNSRPVRDIQPNITFPVISIMAEGDLVQIATVSYNDDPTKPGQKYAGTHFDLFRIENGKIAEHWDSVAKDPKSLKFDPNTQNKP